MGACGCIDCGQTYKLGKEYIVRTYPGCDTCGVGPGLQILKIGKDSYYKDEFEHMKELPVTYMEDDDAVSSFKTGMDPNEFKEKLSKEVSDTIVYAQIPVDATTAEIIADDMWDETFKTPELIDADKTT